MPVRSTSLGFDVVLTRVRSYHVTLPPAEGEYIGKIFLIATSTINAICYDKPWCLRRCSDRCGSFVVENLKWKELTTLHRIRIAKFQNPVYFTSGFTNGPESVEAHLFVLLKSLMKIGKISLKMFLL